MIPVSSDYFTIHFAFCEDTNPDLFDFTQAKSAVKPKRELDGVSSDYQKSSFLQSCFLILRDLRLYSIRLEKEPFWFLLVFDCMEKL